MWPARCAVGWSGGERDEALAHERAEAAATHCRVTEAEARLAAVEREHDAARRRLDHLAAAQGTYAAALEEKEQHLAESGDPRGRSLLQLADERGRLIGEINELSEALAAAGAAEQALTQVQERLGSASSWSTYDTFFGGGAISSAVKHSRLDEAADAAAEADQRLAVLRTELADVDDLTLTAPQLAVGGGTRFVDVWFDNIFTDLAVRDRIRQAQQNVARSMQLVSDVQARLTTRAARVRARLSAIEAERQDLLTR